MTTPGLLAFCISNNHPYLPDQFFWSYLRMMKPNGSFAVKGDTSVKASTINDAIYKGLNLGAEWLFLMDVDQIFHTDTIPRLLETAQKHGAKVVSVLYHTGSHPFVPVAGWKKEEADGTVAFVNSAGADWKKGYAPLGEGVVEVDWAGSGGLLIHKDVIEAVGWAPFADVWEPKCGRRLMGHDVNFCLRAKEKGFKILVDTAVPSEHGKLMYVGREFAQAFHDSDMEGHLGTVMTSGAQMPAYWDVVWQTENLRKQNRDQAYAETFRDVVAAIPFGVESIADVGCGAGALMDHMDRVVLDADLTGYDFSEKAIEIVKGRGFGGKVADFRTYAPNGDTHSYDAVVSTHVIEHVPDDDRFVSLLRALVKPKGTVVVATPWVEEVQGHFEHVRGYTADSLHEVLARHFKEVRVTKNSRDYVAVCTA